MPLAKRHGRPWRGKHPSGNLGRTFEFRAIYVTDSTFTEAYPASDPRPFRDMGLNAMECWIGSGTTNLATRMNLIAAPDKAFSIIGNFTPSAGGGSFNISDANCETIVDSVVGNAQNSHVYYIADEPNLTSLTTPQQDANRTTILNRVNLIKGRDPLARVALADYREAQLDPVASGRANGMWGGVVDEVWLSGYPSPNVDSDPTRIPDQAGWCDDASMPYCGIISAHDFGSSTPDYPTTAQFTTMFNQWKASNARGIVVYIWDDGEGTTHLADDATMQAHIGSLMATVTP